MRNFQRPTTIFVIFLVCCLWQIGPSSQDNEVADETEQENQESGSDEGLKMDDVMPRLQKVCKEESLDCDFDKATDFIKKKLDEGNAKSAGDLVAETLKHIDARTKAKTNSRRKKRQILNYSQLWEKGIVVYKYDTKGKPIDNKNRKVIRNQFDKIEQDTCLRFYEYRDGINDLLKRTQKGFMQLGNYGGCWASIGYGSVCRVSPCKQSIIILHESGHGLGFVHEEERNDRGRFVRRNDVYDQTFADLRVKEGTMSLHVIVNKYDLRSVMHGAVNKKMKDGRLMYQVLDKDRLFMVGAHHSGYTFLDKQAINLGYRCYENFCSKVDTFTCQNLGYPAFVRNKCTCACPDGLSGDRCEKLDIADSYSDWPEASFALPKPLDTGCPEGSWAEGRRTHANDPNAKTDYSKTTPEEIPQWDRNSDQTVLDFCVADKGSGGAFPRGEYCLYRVGDACPGDEFTEGSIIFTSGKGLSISGKMPYGEFTAQKTTMHFCCRSDGIGTINEPIKLPNTKPFYMFPQSGSCQVVKGMMYKRQHMWFGIKTSVRRGTTPKYFLMFGRVYMYICYYYPIKYVDGGIIELSNGKTSETLTSAAYERGLEQKWLVKAAEGSLIQVDFIDFDVYYNKRDGKCIDYVEVGQFGLEYPGIRYCNQKKMTGKTVTSKTNYLLLTFTVQSLTKRQGVKMKVTLIPPEAQCYKLSDDGISYRGTVSFTNKYVPCLRWDSVKHCPFGAFDTRSIGSGLQGHNFCRNPSKITGPWCYIDAEDCIQDMCDPCLLDRCHDINDDCEDEIATKPKYCTENPEAFSGCQKSCNFCREPDEVKKCESPDEMEGASYVGATKNEYSVGETVDFKCTSSGMTYSKMCLSDGTWSNPPAQCKGCATGYVENDGFCYKVFTGRYSWEDAKKACAADDPSYYPAAMSSGTKLILIEEMVKNNPEASRLKSIWTGLYKGDNGAWVFTDGTTFEKQSWQPWGTNGKLDNDHSVVLDSNNIWVSNTELQRSTAVCEGRVKAYDGCMDWNKDCPKLLQQQPGLCLNYPDFARTQCRWSCGICKSPKRDVGQKCDAESKEGNAVLQGSELRFLRGETAVRVCQRGFQLVRGNLERVCLLDGTFAGTPPHCEAIQTLPQEIGHPLRALDKQDRINTAVVSGRPKIPINGFIKEWRFYSKCESHIVMQVYRPAGSTYFINIGENEIETKADRVMYHQVPFDHQIAVKKGDVIGWKNARSGPSPLTYTTCEPSFIRGYKKAVYVNTKAHRMNTKVGQKVKFEFFPKECRNYSVQAYITPTKEKTPEIPPCTVRVPDNANVNDSRSTVAVGTRVAFKCNAGYVVTGGKTIIRCRGSDVWTGKPLVCRLNPCGNHQYIQKDHCCFDPVSKAKRCSDCPEGYVKYKSGRKCYKLIEGKREKYRDYFPDCKPGRLAEPRDEGAVAFLRNHIKQSGGSCKAYWLGLRLRGGKFTWTSDRTRPKYADWLGGKFKKKGCGAAMLNTKSGGLHWVASPCRAKYCPLCESVAYSLEENDYRGTQAN